MQCNGVQVSEAAELNRATTRLIFYFTCHVRLQATGHTKQVGVSYDSYVPM